MVTGRVLAENGFGSRRGLNAQELGADGDAAIGADPDWGACTPHKGPPRTIGFGAQHGAFFFERQVPGFLGSHLEFTVNFVLVAVPTQSLTHPDP